MTDVIGIINSLIELADYVQEFNQRLENYRTNKTTLRELQGHTLAKAVDSFRSLQKMYASTEALFEEEMRAIWTNALSCISHKVADVSAKVGDVDTLLSNSPMAKPSPFSRLYRGAKHVAFANSVSELLAACDGKADALLEYILTLATRLDDVKRRQPVPLLSPPQHVSSGTWNRNAMHGNDEDDDTFEPSFASVPAPGTETRLHFGDATTREASLKRTLLHSGWNIVISAHGVKGMGKTTALHGLAADADVRSAFPDGVYLLTLNEGRGTNAGLAAALASAVAHAGGDALAHKIRHADADDAISLAQGWFSKRCVLFLADDVERTAVCETGVIPLLKRLVQCSATSRLIATTTSQLIADESDEEVRFDALVPWGWEAQGLLLQYAGVDEYALELAGTDGRGMVVDILKGCGGIPVDVAEAGRSVRSRARVLGGWALGLRSYHRDHVAQHAVVEGEGWGSEIESVT